jgi:hypothetical protein
MHLAHLLHHDEALFGLVFSFLCHLVIAINTAGVGPTQQLTKSVK